VNIEPFFQSSRWLSKDGGPRYTQLKRRIQEGVDEGVLTTEAPLPPERTLAEMTGLSRVTVRKAVQELVRSGLVVQRQGSGNFIRGSVPHSEHDRIFALSVFDNTAQQRFSDRPQWLARGIFVPKGDEYRTLDLSPGDQVARMTCLRGSGAKPSVLECSSVPLDLLPDPLEVEDSVLGVLARRDVQPASVTNKIRATALTAKEAELLVACTGEVGLCLERTTFSQCGRAIEFARLLYRGEAVASVSEYYS
jgi:GntR family transcriptional regulator